MAAKPPGHMEVENLKETAAMIRRLGDDDLKRQLKEANKDVAQMVVDAATPNVPVRSGKLLRSVKAAATQTSAYGKAGTPSRVPYAAAIHWGEGTGNVNATTGATFGRPNRNIRGRPFLWEAADATLHQAVRKYEDALDELIDKVVR